MVNARAVFSVGFPAILIVQGYIAKDCGTKKVGQNYQKCQHLPQKYKLFTNFGLCTTEITLQVHIALDANKPSLAITTVL